MKNFLSASFAAAALLTVTNAFAAPASNQQGPAYYGGHGYDQGYRSAYDRGPRPGYRAPYYRPAGYYRAPVPVRYAPAPVRYAPAPRYGYVPAPPVYPQPQPRRPAAVAIRIHL